MSHACLQDDWSDRVEVRPSAKLAAGVFIVYEHDFLGLGLWSVKDLKKGELIPINGSVHLYDKCRAIRRCKCEVFFFVLHLFNLVAPFVEEGR